MTEITTWLRSLRFEDVPAIAFVVMTTVSAIGHLPALEGTRFGRFCLAAGVNIRAILEAFGKAPK